jgi:hypothetical protein
MPNRVTPTSIFERKFKKLSRRFPSIAESLILLENELLANPKLGVSLGSNIYKIKLKNPDKLAGKSGGFRVITYLTVQTENGTEIFLITIYDKSEEENISKPEIFQMIKRIFNE